VKPSRVPLFTAVAALVFLYLPIVVLVIQSFNAARYGGSWQGFTLDWYRQLAGNAPIQRATVNTLIVASVSTFFSLVLGTLAAWVLHRYKGGLQRLHYLLVYAPLVIPDILMGMSLLLLFVQAGIPLGRGTIIIAHTTFCFSYVTLVLIGRLQDFDDNLIDAALDLGARWPTIITRILLPLLGPGLAAGALLAFTLSVDDFVITFLVAGPGSTTLPVHVYGMMKFGSPALVNALSVLFMAATFAIVLTSQLLPKEKS
jgi:spermidine/putrescine transport system permease protein